MICKIFHHRRNNYRICVFVYANKRTMNRALHRYAPRLKRDLNAAHVCPANKRYAFLYFHHEHMNDITINHECVHACLAMRRMMRHKTHRHDLIVTERNEEVFVHDIGELNIVVLKWLKQQKVKVKRT